MHPKSFNKVFEFLLYKTNRLHFSVCVYCNRSQMSQHVKNNSHATTDFVLCRTFLFFTCSDVICDLLQYTHMEKCNLFVKYNSQNTYINTCASTALSLSDRAIPRVFLKQRKHIFHASICSFIYSTAVLYSPIHSHLFKVHSLSKFVNLYIYSFSLTYSNRQRD